MRRTLAIGDCPVEIRGKTKIEWNSPRRGLVSAFTRVLEAAQDERPLQKFFEKHPAALVFGTHGGPHQVWLFPRPQFGTIEGLDSVPDFLICNWSSVGPAWIVVELESPTQNPTNSKGISAVCNHAVQQVNDYRKFFSGNVESLRHAGWPGLNGDCSAWVVIGRRDGPRWSRKDNDRLADFRKSRIEIASYDRLLQKCSEIQSYVNRNSRTVRRLAKKLRA
jgi:hypothetical protein